MKSLTTDTEYEGRIGLGLRKSLLLLGSFSIGYNIAMALHELGHVLAMWATGGSVTRITLSPFYKSFTYFGSDPTFPLVTAWAGVLFGSTIGLLCLVCFWRWRSPWILAIMMTGLCAIAVNGLYLTIDAALLAGGDATDIIDSGTPRLFVLLVGVSLIVLGLTIGYLLLPRMGLTSTDGALARLTILECGVGPYLVAMIVYQIHRNRGEIWEWLTYVMAGIVMLAGIAIGSVLIDKWWSVGRRASIVPTWSAAISSLVGAAIILGVELLAFGE
jgi:hypothetical protein